MLLKGCAPRKTGHKFTTNLGVKFTFLDNNIVILAFYFVMQLNNKLKGRIEFIICFLE